jgi:heme-degrading monooxygenase HmoA
MAHLLVRQSVEDYTKWKEVFDGDVSFRESSGSRGGHVFQSASDPNEVFVLMEWDTMDNLQQFAQSDHLKERMQSAGVTGPPDIYFLDLADSPST